MDASGTRTRAVPPFATDFLTQSKSTNIFSELDELRNNVDFFRRDWILAAALASSGAKLWVCGGSWRGFSSNEWPKKGAANFVGTNLSSIEPRGVFVASESDRANAKVGFERKSSEIVRITGL